VYLISNIVLITRQNSIDILVPFCYTYDMTPARLQAFQSEITSKQNLITQLTNTLTTINTPVARQLYHEKIDQVRLRKDLLEHTIALHEAYELDLENIYHLESAFTILHNKLYPPLHKDLIKGTLNRKKTIRKIKALAINHPDFYEVIESRLQPYLDTDHLVYSVTSSPYNYTSFWNIIQQTTDPYLEGINFEQDTFTYTETKKLIHTIFNNISKCLGVELSWTTKKQRSKLTFSVNQETKTISIPSKTHKTSRLIGLIYHEVFVHILRGINSEKLGLLSPLPNYRAFEEGLGKTLQQLASRKELIYTEFYTQPLIITLSSIGLDFDEITQFLFLTKNKNAKQHLARAERRSIKRRFMLDAIDYNILHYKDLSYGIGGLLVRKLAIKLQTEPNNTPLHQAIFQITTNITLAKFDPTNMAHIAYMHEVGILSFTQEQSIAYSSFLASSEIQDIIRTVPNIV
jgi:hypothetical protein